MPAVQGRLSSAADVALRFSAALWFVTAVAGQLIFAVYIGVHYGGTAFQGDFAAWTETMIHGIVTGDPIGNLAVFVHILLAFVITVCGPIQLLPQVRGRWPRFHRWNGRVYLTTAFIISLGGLYMVWTRGGFGPLSNSIAISINALLIMGCAAMALRFALRREFDRHRRWATRLFLVVSGVWFFRIGLMLWIAINGGPVGVGEDLDGPFSIALTFAQYVAPLAIYELYLRARAGADAGGRFAMAATLIVLTAGMGVGIVMAALFMWLPRL